MTADWAWSTRGSTRGCVDYKSRDPGCSPLTQMAIRSFLVHSSALTPPSLEGLPWGLASILWNSVVKAQLDSVKVWQTFVSAYSHVPFNNMKRNIKRINQPDLPLNIYTEPLLSPDLNWLAILTLQNLSVPRSTLIQCLSRLINLAVLTVDKTGFCPSGPCVDDNLVREWTRHAAESEDGKAFSALRVLNMRMQPAITIRSFERLRALPQLSIINVYESGVGYNDTDAVGKAGWRWRSPDYSPSAIFERQDERDTPSWDSIAHASLKLARSLESGSMAHRKTADTLTIPPCLHLILGRGQPWLADLGDRSLKWGMLTFVRDPDCRLNTFGRSERGQKRLHSEVESQCKTSQRKPNMRPSKQPPMGDVLSSLGA